MSRFSLPLAAMLCGLTSANAIAALSAQQVKKVDEILNVTQWESEPGCSAGVFKQGELVYQSASGLADLTSGLPLDKDTRFYAASLSKQFTALGMMKLVEQGKLKLSDTVQQYFPEFPTYSQPVTISMLIHHTSGIRDALGLMRLAGVPNLSATNLQATLDLMMRQQATDFTPGTQYAYSNGGYLLLAGIIEQVSGLPFQDYMRDTILAPLGMHNSFFAAAPIPDGFTANGYLNHEGRFTLQNDFPAFSGSGGLITSLNDLAKYEYDIAKGHKVWNAATRKAMQTPATFNNGQVVREQHGLIYGGGVKFGYQKGREWMQHTGASSTFKSAYGRLLDSGYSFILLCNRSDGKPADKMHALADLLGNAASDRSDEDKRSHKNLPAPQPGDVPPAGEYYSKELDVVYKVTPISPESAEITMISTWPGHLEPGSKLHLNKDAEGLLRDGPYILEYHQGDKGFSMRRGNIHGIRFVPQ